MPSKKARPLGITEDELEIARQAVESALVEFRDARLSELSRGNGLVIREKNGAASSVIRLGFEAAMAIGLDAIAKDRRSS